MKWTNGRLRVRNSDLNTPGELSSFEIRTVSSVSDRSAQLPFSHRNPAHHVRGHLHVGV